MKSKSSPSKKTTPAATKEREANDPSKMKLQIVESRPTSPNVKSPIKLPGGWVVEQRPRVNSASRPGLVDRYYYEPGSGRQFRSLLAVQKYLSGDMDYALATQRVKPRNQDNMQIVPHGFRSASPFKLPQDWIVEEKPRSNVKYAGVVDRYYIEPGTGQRFRSLRTVERHFAGMETIAAASEVPKSLGSLKKQKSVEVEPMLDFTSPPAKVKWVLGGPGGSLWNPFVGDSVVPESIQQTWSETFMLSIPD